MPLLRSAFAPPPLLANGHLQTLLPVLLPRRLRLAFAPESLELGDGDFLHLDWLRGGNARLAILSHGLESDTEAGYIRGMTRALQAAGWDVLAWSMRGCGPSANRLLRFYHSGETGDLGALIDHAATGYAQIALIGFSLGGNITLKYLGEPSPHRAIVAGVAISAPVDLASSALAIDSRRLNRLYRLAFLFALRGKIRQKARRFPRELDVTGLRGIGTLREFDDRYTAPLHGFRDAADYWARASSRPFLPAIRVPTLLLNARNDPMLDAPSFPYAEAEQNPSLFLETPDSGGHVGFMDFRDGLNPWSERRAVEFLSAHGYHNSR